MSSLIQDVWIVEWGLVLICIATLFTVFHFVLLTFGIRDLSFVPLPLHINVKSFFSFEKAGIIYHSEIIHV